MADQDASTPSTGTTDDSGSPLLLRLRREVKRVASAYWSRLGSWWRWLRKRWSWPWWQRQRLGAKVGYLLAVLAAVVVAVGLVGGLGALVWFFPRGVWRVVAFEAVLAVAALVLVDLILILKPEDAGDRWRVWMTALSLVGASAAIAAGVVAGLAGGLDPHRANSIVLAAGLALVVAMVLADRWKRGISSERTWGHVVRAIVGWSVLGGLVASFAVWPERVPPVVVAVAVGSVVFGATAFLVGPLASLVWRVVIAVLFGGSFWLFAASEAGLLTLKLLVASAVALLAWRLASPLRLRGWSLTRATAAGLVGVVVFARLDGFPSTDRGRVTLIAVAVVVVGLFVALRRKPELLTLRPRSPHRSHADATRRHARELTSDGGAVLVDAIDCEFGGTTRPESCRPSCGGASRVGKRAVHSHGTLVRGWFLPAAETAKRLPATLWKTPKITSIVRFSNFSGDPDRNDRQKGVHGMAISLRPDDGDGIDLVLMDLDRFFASTREDFLAFTEAFGTPGVLRRLYRLTGLILFRRTTLPLVMKLIGLKHISSYLEPTYFGVNAFVWTIDGVEHHARIEAVPMSDVTPLRPLPDDPEYLHKEVRESLTEPGTRTHRVDLVLGDGLGPARLTDAMTPWPKSQDRLLLGHLELDPTGEEGSVERFDRMVFDPHRLPLGVRPSADEILMARRAAYAESHVRRERAVRSGATAGAGS